MAVCLLSISALLARLDREFLPAMILGLSYVPFELVLGTWLVFK